MTAGQCWPDLAYTFLVPQPNRCYYYPGRDCPGWQPGQMCSRIDLVIPATDADDDD